MEVTSTKTDDQSWSVVQTRRKAAQVVPATNQEDSIRSTTTTQSKKIHHQNEVVKAASVVVKSSRTTSSINKSSGHKNRTKYQQHDNDRRAAGSQKQQQHRVKSHPDQMKPKGKHNNNDNTDGKTNQQKKKNHTHNNKSKNNFHQQGRQQNKKLKKNNHQHQQHKVIIKKEEQIVYHNSTTHEFKLQEFPTLGEASFPQLGGHPIPSPTKSSNLLGSPHPHPSPVLSQQWGTVSASSVPPVPSNNKKQETKVKGEKSSNSKQLNLQKEQSRNKRRLDQNQKANNNSNNNNNNSSNPSKKATTSFNKVKNKTNNKESILGPSFKSPLLTNTNAKSTTLQSSSKKSTKPTLLLDLKKQSQQIQHRLDEEAFAFHKSNMLPLGKTVKGKQKIRARKKRLTPLKKQVLKERLMQWKQTQQKEDEKSNPSLAQGGDPKIVEGAFTSIVYLHNFIEEGECIDDDDEYEEIVSDLNDMAQKVGPIHGQSFIPRDSIHGIVFVNFQNELDAIAAKSCWDGMVIGGNQIKVGIVSESILQKHTQHEGDSRTNHNEWTEILRSRTLSELEVTTKNDIDQSSATVVLGNILTEDDFEDEGCMEESLEDVQTLVSKYGTLSEIHVDGLNKAIHVTFEGGRDIASIAIANLDGIVLGGQIISATLLQDNDNGQIEGMESTIHNVDNGQSSIVYLDGYIEKGECIDDDEEYDEIISDLNGLAEKVGPIHGSFIPKEAKHGLAFVYFTSKDNAKAAILAWDGMVVGGNNVVVGLIDNGVLGKENDDADTFTERWMEMVEDTDVSALTSGVVDQSSGVSVVILSNILTEDDFEDEGCLEESLEDIRMLVSKHGTVSGELVVDPISKSVHISFEGGNDVASSVVASLDGIVIGGQIVSARVQNVSSSGDTKACQPNAPSSKAEKIEESKTDPLYSGDKVIPEQYAACKRVPKVPNSGQPRAYASLLNNEDTIPLLYEMLGELMRLQLRSKDDKNAKARRRLVMGLREVARGVRANKVKMIIMANNLDEYGVIDEKLQGIIETAKEKDVPIIYELNKRKIGKALGKSIKVAVVGVQNADGAQVQFKRLKTICR